ncbi:leucine-rich repeat-containing protein 70 isoform 1-T2 [Discoglossus pictus]
MKGKHRDVQGSQRSFTLHLCLHCCILMFLLHIQVLCCPTLCKLCTERQVNCCGLNLTSIPRNLSKSTTLICLSGNNITQISSNDFNELKKLAVLYMDNSSVCCIQPNAFALLTKLYNLYLNNNYIRHLDPGVFEGLSNLHYLYLQHNQIPILHQGLFGNLRALRFLSLQKNRLNILGSDTFFGMISLHSLNLASNNISRISATAFRNLENLEHLYLEGNNLIQVPSHALGLLKNLKRLSLSNNPLGSINHFAFRGLDSLHYLFLENANIQVICENAFYGINHLKQLILTKNELTTLNSKTFTFLNNLLYLQIDRNKIVSISDNTFEEIGVSLKVLNLAYNNLTVLQPKVLQPLISLSHFQASYNPWDCGCHLLEIRNFLLSSSFTFSINCHDPAHLRGRPLRTVKRTEFESCVTTNALLKIRQYVDLARTVVSDIRIKKCTDKLISEAGSDDLFTSTKSAFHASPRSNLQQTTTNLPLLSLDLPLRLAPVNLTREAYSLLPPDAVSVSLKPYVVCQQKVETLNQAFHILLSFFILSCAVIILLIFKLVQLKRRLITPESQGESALEYYSCYHSSRYQITDPIRPAPQPPPLRNSDIDLIRPLKQSAPNTQTQVILFEHSVL